MAKKSKRRWQKALDESVERLAEQHPQYKARLAKERLKKTLPKARANQKKKKRKVKKK